MSDVENRYAPWPDLVAELMTSPATSHFPRRVVEDALRTTFKCQDVGLVPGPLEHGAAPHRLTVPVRTAHEDELGYVLVRSARAFTDDDLELARRIQPLLELLDRQALILQRRRTPPCGLTARERATLALLSDGLTAGAIARRLGVSPRTVNKHLEHLYRKLDVGDRLQAVLVARDTGMLGQRPRSDVMAR